VSDALIKLDADLACSLKSACRQSCLAPKLRYLISGFWRDANKMNIASRLEDVSCEISKALTARVGGGAIGAHPAFKFATFCRQLATNLRASDP